MSRKKMSLQLKHKNLNANNVVRNVKVSDAENLADALLDAYKNTIDYEGEDYNDALREINKVLNNGYEGFISEASFLTEKNNKIVSAIFINLFEGKPLITNLFTRKEYSNMGLAKTLLKYSINKLYELNYKELILFVTMENENAVSLYRNIGFKEL